MFLNIVSKYFIYYTFDTSIHKIYHKVHVYYLPFFENFKVCSKMPTSFCHRYNVLDIFINNISSDLSFCHTKIIPLVSFYSSRDFFLCGFFSWSAVVNLVRTLKTNFQNFFETRAWKMSYRFKHFFFCLLYLLVSCCKGTRDD